MHYTSDALEFHITRVFRPSPPDLVTPRYPVDLVLDLGAREGFDPSLPCA